MTSDTGRKAGIWIAGATSAVFALVALAWTLEVIRRPYGWGVEALTSDSTYFDWSPLDTVEGQSGTVALGRQRRILRRLPRFDLPGMAELSAWAEPIMGRGPTSLARVDSLLAWWRGVFGSYPLETDVVPRVIPVGRFHKPHSVPALCSAQAEMFMAVLLSQRIHCRWVFLNSNFGSSDYAGHTLLEVWSPELGKWVLVDPMMGTRYERGGEPVSLREMAVLRANGRLNEVDVICLGTRTRFPEYRFPMRYLATDSMAVLFNGPGLWISEIFLADPRDDELRYYLSWRSSAGMFDPVPREYARRNLRVARAGAAWLVVLAGVAGMIWLGRAAVAQRRRR